MSEPISFDAVADLIHGQLDEDDAAQPHVRHDVEHAPDSIPGEVWRGALSRALAELARARDSLLDQGWERAADGMDLDELRAAVGRLTAERDAAAGSLTEALGGAEGIPAGATLVHLADAARQTIKFYGNGLTAARNVHDRLDAELTRSRAAVERVLTTIREWTEVDGDDTTEWNVGFCAAANGVRRLVDSFMGSLSATAPAAQEAASGPAGSPEGDGKGAGVQDGSGGVEDDEATPSCICPRFTDTGGFRIADLACPIHGVGGSRPGDGPEEDGTDG